MAKREMMTENFISSKARPVARNLKVNANLSSTNKLFLITVYFLFRYGVIFLSSSLKNCSSCGSNSYSQIQHESLIFTQQVQMCVFYTFPISYLHPKYRFTLLLRLSANKIAKHTHLLQALVCAPIVFALSTTACGTLS